MCSSSSETSQFPEESEYRGERCIIHHSYGSNCCLSNQFNTQLQKDDVKVHHKIATGKPFPDKWLTTNDSQIDEIVLHYKRLLDEAEDVLACKENIIELLRNQLFKIENLYKDSVSKMENYRFKFSIASKELENLRKISAQYKQNIDKLLGDCEVPALRDASYQLENENIYLKRICNDLSKRIELQNQMTKASVSTGTQLNRDSDSLDYLKRHCFEVENLLEVQNINLELLIKYWKDQEENFKTYANNIFKIPSNYEEILINISNQASFHNQNLLRLLKENQDIKNVVKNLEIQILRNIPSIDSTNNIGTTYCVLSNKCQNTKGSVEELNNTMQLSTELNHLMENIHAKDLVIKEMTDTINRMENEKEEFRMTYGESYKKEYYMNAELRDNTNELNTKIEELRVELLSFQNLSDTLKKENDMYLKERNYYLLQESSRKLAEEHLNQSLQQYKEQLQFKTLENQKLREVETELRKQIQDLEYDAEQMDRRCLVELKERNIVIVSLQEEYGQYKKEAEKKEELLKQEGMAAMQLVMSKSQELHILEEDLKHLREKLNSTNIEHEKILHQNEKALNEISSLYRSKEVQCFELEQKLNTLEATAAEIDEEHPRKQELDIANALPTDEISHVKSELLILFRDVLEVLRNVQECAVNKTCESIVPPTVIEEIASHLHRFTVVLENGVDDTTVNCNIRVHCDTMKENEGYRAGKSYTIIPNQDSKKGLMVVKKRSLPQLNTLEHKLYAGNVHTDNDSDSSHENATTRPTSSPRTVDDVGGSGFMRTMQQIENDLKELKDQLKEATAKDDKTEKETSKCQSPACLCVDSCNRMNNKVSEHIDIQVTVAEDSQDIETAKIKSSSIPVPILQHKPNENQCKRNDQKRSTSVPPNPQTNSTICSCNWCELQRLHPQTTAAHQLSNRRECSTSCKKGDVKVKCNKS